MHQKNLFTVLKFCTVNENIESEASSENISKGLSFFKLHFQLLISVSCRQGGE